MQRHPARHPTSIALAAAAALLAGASTGARAQAAAPDAAASAAASDAQVIVVTAQGRKQEVQKVPISLQLVGPEDIAKAGAVNLSQLADFVPGLTVDASQPTQPSYSLRGLGNGDFGIGTDAPVGVYVNGVYTGKTGGAMLNFNDVKRIEVLKGPQGTLFGRNSAGGAISIVTNDPDGQHTVSGLVRAGNYGTVHAEGLVNQPLGEDFSLRISAVGEKSDGWATNTVDGKKNPEAKTWGTRVGGRWSPSDATSVVLTWEHEDLNERPRPIWAAGSYNQDGTITYVDPRHEALANDVAGGKEARTFNGLNLRIEHELGDKILFTSTTGLRHFNSVNLEDNDGTANAATYLATGNFEKSTTFEQEFRLNGKSSTADWLVGASFANEHSKQTSRVDTNTTTLDPVLEQVIDQQLLALGQPPLPAAPLGLMTGIAQSAGVTDFNLLGQDWKESMNNTLAAHSEALMADVIWHLDDHTNVTTGLRFTQDTKKFSWYSPLRSAPGLDAQLAAVPGLLQQVVDAGGLDQGTADGLSGIAQGIQQTNIEFTNPAWAAAPVYTSKTWHNTSPRLVIDHQLTPDAMVYGSVTRGYQAGGFNSVSTDANGGHFDPETITSYELGAKGRVAGAGISYSASLFHYLFKNLQSINFVQPTDGSVGFYAITVSDVEATGLDAELNWQIASPVRLYANGEWIDQKYKSQKNLAPGAHDLTGQPYGTPSLSLAAGVDFTMALAGGKAAWSLQGSHIGATRCNDDSTVQGSCLSTPAFKVGEAHDRLDTRIAWSAPADHWGVALIVNNLLDKRYVTGLSNLSAAVGVPYTASVSDPRKFQIEFSARL